MSVADAGDLLPQLLVWARYAAGAVLAAVFVWWRACRYARRRAYGRGGGRK